MQRGVQAYRSKEISGIPFFGLMLLVGAFTWPLLGAKVWQSKTGNEDAVLAVCCKRLACLVGEIGGI